MTNTLNFSKESGWIQYRSDDSSESRFVVGIDLGTTNSAVAYVDTQSTRREICPFLIPQAVAPQVIESRATLPSFACQASDGSWQFPWKTSSFSESEISALARIEKKMKNHRMVVGAFARDFGSKNTSSFIASAKSWLCHHGVDRTSKILPWSLTGEETRSAPSSAASIQTESAQNPKSISKWSPVEVSAFYLAQIHLAWNLAFPAFPLADQEIILTLPASFDEVARELTIQAAKMAGLNRITLIEEPQAAFYSWIYFHEKDWQTLIRVGQKIIVCDVGGGTTDLTMIRVIDKKATSSASKESKETPLNADSELTFHRVAVGEHLILGGDNLDLALASYLETRLVAEGKLPPLSHGKLSQRHWEMLVRLSCQLKEKFLGDVPLDSKSQIHAGDFFSLAADSGAKELVSLPKSGLSATQTSDDAFCDSVTINLAGIGSKLIGGSVSLKVTRKEVEKILIDGFFPNVSFQNKPQRKRSGFQELGLPYASDPAITKHIAHFLALHRHSGDQLLAHLPENAERPDSEGAAFEQSKSGPSGGAQCPVPSLFSDASFDPARPDVILFNGGVFRSSKLQRRIVDNIVQWFDGGSDQTRWQPLVLENADLDLAVSRGAAYYGMVRRGIGLRISASLARTYYIGIQGGRPVSTSGTGTAKKASFAGSTPVSAEKDSSNDFDKPRAEDRLASRETSLLCIIPASMEPGDEVGLKTCRFDLTVGSPVVFPIYSSSVRLTDEPGLFYQENDEEMKALPPIQTVLKTRSQTKQAGKTVQVELSSRLTELGTIELFLKEVPSGPSKRYCSHWKLQFDVRSATQTDRTPAPDSFEESPGSQEVLEESVVESVRQYLSEAFGDVPRGTAEAAAEAVAARGTANAAAKVAANAAANVAVEKSSKTHLETDRTAKTPLKPGEVMKRLTEILECGRDAISLPMLRRIGETLLEFQQGRNKSAAWESRWLNLLGFAYRPGFGIAMDDWRVDQVWKTVFGNLAFTTVEVRTQTWILWRRLASGLSVGQQETLAAPLIGNVRNLRRQLVESRGKGPDLDLSTQEGAEIWRLLGALELLSLETKKELGDWILDMIGKKKLQSVTEAMLWALGRLGTRNLFHGPLNAILPASVVERWIDRLLERGTPSTILFFALTQMTRTTCDRNTQVNEATRDRVIGFLSRHDAPEHWIQLISEQRPLQEEENRVLFGETLPLGLKFSE